VVYDVANKGDDAPAGTFTATAAGNDTIISRGGEAYLRLVGVNVADVDLDDFSAITRVA
jgi:hypothetical protein